MKSLIFFTFAFVIVTTIAISCSKSSSSPAPVVKPSVFNIITNNSWKLSSAHGVSGTTVVSYDRGGFSNTFNFDNEFITFNKNNSGTYTDNNGITSNFTWFFDAADSSQLTWTVQFSPSATIHWAFSKLNADSLAYDEYYIQGSTATYSSEVRIPK